MRVAEPVREEDIWDAADELLEVVHEYEDERTPQKILSKNVAYEAAVYVLVQGCESREDLFNTIGSLTAYFGGNFDEKKDSGKFRPDSGLNSGEEGDRTAN
jgi:hypothetical protein